VNPTHATTDRPPRQPAPSAAEVDRFLAAYTAGGDGLVIELRALEVPQRYGRPLALSGFFDLADPGPLRRAVAELVGRPAGEQPEGVYVTLNPVSPALLGRANQRLRPAGKKAMAASDADVLRRRWLLIDVDPTRPAGISSTDEEKAAALAVITGVRRDLDARGFPAPLVVDSGNGFHLWYRIDLPAADGGRVERTIKGLAGRHNTAAATLDTSVFNPSRIAKLPGTFARKGDDVPGRPHRMARVLEVPA
jgi:hypothetical protein